MLLRDVPRCQVNNWFFLSLRYKGKKFFVSLKGFRGRGSFGGGPNFDVKGGDWLCPNRFVFE